MNKLFTAGILAGALIGMVSAVQSKKPRRKLSQIRRDWSFQRAYDKASRTERIPVQPGDRYIIFSDHHKGIRDGADDFLPCETTYLGALDHYHAEGYRLIILGDAEELWEEDIPDVINAYTNVLKSEARFFPERYLKVIGNHDNLWASPQNVQKYLHPFFPGLEIKNSLILEFSRANGAKLGEALLAHGHQGTIDSDILDFIGPMVLPVYKILQNLTGGGRTTPANDDCLRSRQDTQMYRWAREKHKLFLIAGHTHRPVWSSFTHLERLLWQLQNLLDLPPAQQPEDYEAQIQAMIEQIEYREKEAPPCDDTIKTRPSYFNGGCCRFADGDITGIEIQDAFIRLIKWKNQGGQSIRSVLQESRLEAIFAAL